MKVKSVTEAHRAKAEAIWLSTWDRGRLEGEGWERKADDEGQGNYPRMRMNIKVEKKFGLP